VNLWHRRELDENDNVAFTVAAITGGNDDDRG